MIRLESSTGEPIPAGTVVALGPPNGRRQPELEAFSHIRPASPTDEMRQVIGVVTIAAKPPNDPMHVVAIEGLQVVRADEMIPPGAWGWPTRLEGVLSEAAEGWWVLERIDELFVRAFVRALPIRVDPGTLQRSIDATT